MACPDDLMTAWLDGADPTGRAGDDLRLGPDRPVRRERPGSEHPAYANALDAGAIGRRPDLQHDDYLYVLADDALSRPAATSAGRSPTTPTDTGHGGAPLDACEFTPDLPLDGDGETDDEAGTFELDLRGPGTTLHYERDGDGGDLGDRHLRRSRTVSLKAAA